MLLCHANKLLLLLLDPLDLNTLSPMGFNTQPSVPQYSALFWAQLPQPPKTIGPYAYVD